MFRLLFVITVIAVINADPQNIAFAENLETYSKANHDFALSLYTKLAEIETGNIIYSPLSIHVIMFMTSIGAVSKTLDEIIKTIHLTNIKYSVEDYSAMLKRITDGYNNLKLVSAIFIDEDFNVKDSFLAKSNLSPFWVYKSDFKNKHESWRQTINMWVSNKTEHKIEELFPKELIDANTALVLVNAVHFKSPWVYKFYEINKEPFYSYSKKIQSVKMMTLMHDLQYYHDMHLKYSAVELPYNYYNFKMIILLPDDKDGLKSLEKNLVNINLNNIFKQMNEYHVSVKLPSFKIEQSLYLEEAFKRLGCSTMFTPRANFSKISNKGGLYVNNLVHKAFIEVNENGTLAAGATGGSVSLLSLPLPRTKVQFTVDHPFLFFIVSEYNDIILLGRVLQV
ncbi:Serpin domain,Serpin, conserved site [Cinara cedri]|uniref:Serpin domain,Serpin, conserved site n=1 Tax=Cinara cedri TaxID=506608 RepID=A0A5E4M4X1_9HEMI|nr:Serpin domain,Serpin, conserved site [Cinara cedri]